jgi:methionyl-tRNA formyltransferase
MNIIFFGSDNFAVPSLRALIANGYSIFCVVTQPDRERGRGLSLAATAIKLAAQELGLKIYQPNEINSAQTLKFLKALNPDLFVVIAYGQLLSREILDIPRIISINIHASLLPKYRGAAPINWAIINGETATGVTAIKMASKMDAGPIIQQKDTGINKDDTSVTLEDKLSKVAAGLLIDSLKSIENNSYKLTPQDENRASFAPKLKKENGLILWSKPAQEIYNLIRGCLGWPDAFTYYKGKLLKIYKARVSSQVPACRQAGRKFASSNLGEILEASREGIVVFAGKGNIIIEELQIEGKRRMRVEEFIAGHKILPGEILRAKK